MYHDLWREAPGGVRPGSAHVLRSDEMMFSTESIATEDTAPREAPGSRGPTLAEYGKARSVELVALGCVLIGAFWPSLRMLARDLSNDPDLSHGFLVPIISGWILYSRRREVLDTEVRRSVVGGLVLCVGWLLYSASYITITNTGQRIGMWWVLVGATWFLFGSRVLRRVSFSLAFLLCAIPPPFFLLSPFRLWLKNLATRLSSDILQLVGVAAIPHGNILDVGGTQLEVADACSGVRSLMAIVTTAVLFCYLFRTGWSRGALLVGTAVPVTVFVNVLRIVVVALALAWLRIDLTTGAAHDALGLAVFGVSLLALWASWRFWDWMVPCRRTEEPS